MTANVEKFYKELINFLKENIISYSDSKESDLNTFTVYIPSPKTDRRLEIELYEGGYNLHFSIDNFSCFDEHVFLEDSSKIEKSLLNLVVQIYNEEIVGFKAEYAGSIREFYCKPEDINKHIEKRIASLEYSQDKGHTKNKDYKFSVRSFKSTFDKDTEGNI